MTRRAPRESRCRDAAARPGRQQRGGVRESDRQHDDRHGRQPPRNALLGRRDLSAGHRLHHHLPIDRGAGLRGRRRRILPSASRTTTAVKLRWLVAIPSRVVAHGAAERDPDVRVDRRVSAESLRHHAGHGILEAAEADAAADRRRDRPTGSIARTRDSALRAAPPSTANHHPRGCRDQASARAEHIEVLLRDGHRLHFPLFAVDHDARRVAGERRGACHRRHLIANRRERHIRRRRHRRRSRLGAGWDDADREEPLGARRHARQD